MAISVIHHRIVHDLFESGLLPQGGALLEIGQANWHGDASPLDLVGDIEKFVADPRHRAALVQKLQNIVAANAPGGPFEVAEVFYEIFFAPAVMQAVDFQGSARALRLDLNGPLRLDRRFNVVINHQTAEHVFHIAQVFKTIHEHSAAGAVMIHECLFTGAIDQGFYNVQPTLFFDLAQANDYQLVGLFIEDLASRSIAAITRREDVYSQAKASQIPDEALLLAVMIKGAAEREFEYPVQGYYRNALDDAGKKAWVELR
jgi:hypothetical protein